MILVKMGYTITLFVNSVLFCIVYGQKRTCQIAIEGGIGGYGQCKSIFNCKPVLSLANKVNKTIEEYVSLQKSHCGIDNYAPAVCCPIQSNPLPCYTPFGKPGLCISVYSCPEMIKLLTPRPAASEVLKFVQDSRCAGSNQQSVCCGPIPDFRREIRMGECDRTSDLQEIMSGCCGVDGSIYNLIYGGSQVQIDDFPWLAMIEYNKNGTMSLIGNGALISGKYVLTSAVSVDVELVGIPVNIRLGEYDTSHEGPDCVQIDGRQDCTDGAISIPIERIITHPMYDSRDRINDIALVRMSKAAPFTEFIKPICLPTADVTQMTGSVYFNTAGWRASEANQQSDVKLQGTLTYINLNQCQSQYRQARRNITLNAGHLCAEAQNGTDTCQSDSILMYKKARRYEYIGILHGATPCGLTGVPTVYTNVYAYISWIRATIGTTEDRI